MRHSIHLVSTRIFQRISSLRKKVRWKHILGGRGAAGLGRNNYPLDKIGNINIVDK